MSKETPPFPHELSPTTRSMLYVQRHRLLVAKALHAVADELVSRARDHDWSKLLEDEFSFTIMARDLFDNVPFGTDEYETARQKLLENGKGLNNHYARNTHHPEFFADKDGTMNLIDIIEMVCDWWASHADNAYMPASKRWTEKEHHDSFHTFLHKSGIGLNKKRFADVLTKEQIAIIDATAAVLKDLLAPLPHAQPSRKGDDEMMTKYGVDPLASDVARPGERHYDASDEALAEAWYRKAERQQEMARKMASEGGQRRTSPFDRHMESVRHRQDPSE